MNDDIYADAICFFKWLSEYGNGDCKDSEFVSSKDIENVTIGFNDLRLNNEVSID